MVNQGRDLGTPLSRVAAGRPARHDVVVVGGGHNGLTAAAYLAQAGRSVLVLERADHLGGAAVSSVPFPGVDARLSRYSYLVSLMPRAVRDELGLDLQLRRRRISSYTPSPADPSRGLLVDTADAARTRSSFARVGAAADAGAWEAFGHRTRALAESVFPTVTRPLPSEREARRLLGRRWWRDLVEEPLGALVERTFAHDLVRGVVLTDALIGTFASARSTSLVQNRCWLYHVIGGGTGDWDVPVGGMGAVSTALAEAAVRAGATLATNARVTALHPGEGEVEVEVVDDDGVVHVMSAGRVVAACSPWELGGLLDDRRPAPHPDGRDARPEGAQLKVNMVLARLPRLRDSEVTPEEAFAGTFHVNETYDQLERAYAQAAAGRVPTLPPAEIYCHTLTDPSILSPGLRAAGAHTMTLFGLHMPERLFREDPDGTRAQALEATLRSLDAVLDEPLEECLLRDADGRPCLEVRSPVDLERDVALPAGHIFHRDLAWPWSTDATAEPDGTPDVAAQRAWGVQGPHPRVLLAGAGAVRGGGVSGIPGRSAAHALLATT